MNLQTRLLGAFGVMGGIVLTVGFVGWNGNNQLSRHVNTLGDNTLPSVSALWKMNEGQTQVQSSERALLNTELSPEERQAELGRIQTAWKQIDEGFEQYKEALKYSTEEEKKLFKGLEVAWADWKQDHEKFVQEYQRIH